jgi:hypothetical protein
LAVGNFFRGSEQIQIQSRFSRAIQQYGDQEDLSVVQRHTKLAAVRPDQDVVYRPVTQLAHGFRHAPQVLY